MTVFHPFIQSPLNESWDEIFNGGMPVDDQCLPFEYKSTLSFDMSCDEHMDIFNKLMSVTPYAFNRFQKRALKSSRTLIFQKGVVHLAHWVFFKPKEAIKYSRLVLMDSTISQEGVFNV